MDVLDLHLGDAEPWRGFLEGRADVAAPLARCWQRVQSLGVGPEGPEGPVVVDSTALRAHRDRVGPLLSDLGERLAPMRARFEARDFRLLLANAEGVVLHAAGGGAFAADAERLRLIEGSSWSEDIQGTNAMGTALVERRPVTVYGAAHFARPNHGLVCYAAPIFAPDGELLGVLDATSYAVREDPLGALAVTAAARLLEDGLRERAYARLDGASQALVAQILDRCRGPALFIERGGRLRRANHAAAVTFPAVGRWRSGSSRKAADLSCTQVLGHPWPSLEEAAQRGSALPLLGAAARRFRLELEPIVDRRGHVLAVMAFAVPLPTISESSPHELPRPLTGVTGTDPRLTSARRTAAKLAPSAIPVLLLAETGTGKDVMARAIHGASHRADQPFVALNCAAFSEGLLAAELFGHGPGAFTGAAANGRDGHVAAADGGTLFLDEVAEMAPPLQAALLRFLEDGSYHRVGESHVRRSDVRLISATCRDLGAMVAEGTFRSDLYYRLRGARLSLPPLRERSDLELLVSELLQGLAREQAWDEAPSVTAEGMAWLRNQPWPGNIRELKNVLLRATVLVEANEGLGPQHFEDEAAPPSLPPPTAAAPSPPPFQRAAAPLRSLDEAERQALERALEAADGNVSEAARTLGAARSTVYRLMRKHGFAS